MGIIQSVSILADGIMIGKWFFPKKKRCGVQQVQGFMDVLNFKKAKADLAYAQSYVGVKLIVDSIGWEAIRKILGNGLQSKQWDEAFYSVLEMDEEAYELYFLEFIETHYRWNFLYQSDYVIWILIPISVVFIYLIIRLRNFRTYKKWSAEEELTKNNLEFDE